MTDPTPPLSPPTPRVVETTWAVEEAYHDRWFLVAPGMPRNGAIAELRRFRNTYVDQTFRLVRRETTETVEEV